MGIAQGIEGKAVGQAAGRTGTWEAPGIPVISNRLFLESISIKNKSASTGFCPGREHQMPR